MVAAALRVSSVVRGAGVVFAAAPPVGRGAGREMRRRPPPSRAPCIERDRRGIAAPAASGIGMPFRNHRHRRIHARAPIILLRAPRHGLSRPRHPRSGRARAPPPAPVRDHARFVRRREAPVREGHPGVQEGLEGADRAGGPVQGVLRALRSADPRDRRRSRGGRPRDEPPVPGDAARRRRARPRRLVDAPSQRSLARVLRHRGHRPRRQSAKDPVVGGHRRAGDRGRRHQPEDVGERALGRARGIRRARASGTRRPAKRGSRRSSGTRARSRAVAARRPTRS